MDTEDASDVAASTIAAAIGEPARARMLYSLMDGHTRTSTELSTIANVSPATASAHLARLRHANLVAVAAQGKHRYYRLASGDVATVLESLSVLAGEARGAFVPTTPSRLRAARTCYDHLAGEIGVALHDRFVAMVWLTPRGGGTFDLTEDGAAGFAAIGIDIAAVRAQRRVFARECLDWSERRPHLGGGLAAALLKIALGRRWLIRDLDSRAVAMTAHGRAELHRRFGIVS